MYTTWTILYELQRGVRIFMSLLALLSFFSVKNCIFMSILALFSFLCKDLSIVEAEKELTCR